MKKLVFNFKSKDTKKINNPKNILGGKGASLAEMGRLGYPVPSGFTISTEVCHLFFKNNKKIHEIRKDLTNIGRDDDYEGVLKEFSLIKKEVNDFFENVIVNDEDELIKKNRLELLQMLCKTFDNYLNFSKVESL